MSLHIVTKGITESDPAAVKIQVGSMIRLQTHKFRSRMMHFAKELGGEYADLDYSTYIASVDYLITQDLHCDELPVLPVETVRLNDLFCQLFVFSCIRCALEDGHPIRRGDIYSRSYPIYILMQERFKVPQTYARWIVQRSIKSWLAANNNKHCLEWFGMVPPETTLEELRGC